MSSNRSLVRAALIALLLLFGASLPTHAFDQAVYDIQVLLTDLGYDPGPADGLPGRRTSEAITRMQSESGLPETENLSVVLEQLAAREAPEPSATQAHLPIELVPQVGHSSGILALAVSDDGRFFVTSGYDGARLWDVATRRIVRRFDIAEEVSDIDLSPDGRTLIGALDSGALIAWEVETGRQIRRIDMEASVEKVAFVGRGNSVAVAMVESAGIWDFRTGKKLLGLSGPKRWFAALAVSADGQLVATGDAKGNIVVSAVASGRAHYRLNHGSDTVQSLAFSADGRHLLSGASENKSVRLWDLTSGGLARSFEGLEYPAFSVAFSSDGQKVVAGSQHKQVMVWSLDTGRRLDSYDTWSGVISDAAAVPGTDGVILADWDGVMQLVDLAEAASPVPIYSANLPLESVSMSAAGDVAFTVGKDGAAVIHDLATGVQRALEPTGSPFGLSGALWDGTLSRDGRFAAAMGWDGKVTVWDVPSGRIARTIPVAGLSSQVEFSPDGRLMALGDDGDYTRLISFPAGSELLRLEHPGDVFDFDFTPDGKVLAAVYDNHDLLGTTGIQFFDIATRSPSWTIYLQGGTIFAAAFSPDGKQVAFGTLSGSVELWDMESQTRISMLAPSTDGFGDSVMDVVFTPDGRHLAIARGALIQLLETASGVVVETFRGHFSDVESLAVTPDGKRLVSAGADGAMRVWDLDEGKPLSSSTGLVGASGPTGHWLTMTPEGFIAASSQGTEALLAVRGLEAVSLDQVYDALYRPDLVAAKLAGDPEGLVAAAAAQLDLDAVVGSGSAPLVIIASPIAGAGVPEDYVEVAAEITDQGGGVGKVEWRVNGVTLGVDQRSIEVEVADNAGASVAAPIRVTQMLTLDPGENRIEVLAYNGKGLIASEPASITVSWDGASISTPPKLYVLSVGVNTYYDSRLTLNYAAPDARAISAAFAMAGKDLYESVDVTTVLDSDVTVAHLEEVFTDLSRRIRPRDVFVLFMAGHGKTVDGRYYFLPADFRYVDESSVATGGIGQDAFQAWLARIPARKSVLLYDTCDSGSLTGSGVASRGLEEVAALARMTRAMGRTVLSASTDDAPALEGYNGHGVFTYALLQTLGEGDANGDGTIEVTELASSIDRLVPEISYTTFNFRQIPQMSILGSDFPLTHKAQVLAAATGEADRQDVLNAPTHVVVATASVYERDDSSSKLVSNLAPGTLVTLIREAESGFVLVGRAEGRLGFVKAEQLATLQ